MNNNNYTYKTIVATFEMMDGNPDEFLFWSDIIKLNDDKIFCKRGKYLDDLIDSLYYPNKMVNQDLYIEKEIETIFYIDNKWTKEYYKTKYEPFIDDIMLLYNYKKLIKMTKNNETSNI